MPHLNSINEPPHPCFSDNSYTLNANFQVISLTNAGYIQLLTEQTSHCCERTTLWAVPLNSFLNSGPADWTQDQASTPALYDWATPQPPRSFCCFSSWGISLALNLRPALFAAFCTFFARLLVLFRLGWHLMTLPRWADNVSSIGLLKSILPRAPGVVPSHHFRLNYDNSLPKTISEPAGTHSYPTGPDSGHFPSWREKELILREDTGQEWGGGGGS